METITSLGIIDSYSSKLKQNISVDVAVVGGGPSGLIAAYYLAQKGRKVALFERQLAPGGGMWGGAMMFNQIMVQKNALPILAEFQIATQPYKEDFHLVDSVHSSSALIYGATKAGVTIFNCFSAEDLVLHQQRVAGIVVNWGPVHKQGLHVDPLVFMAKTVLDATGHPSELAQILARKNQVRLLTPSGTVMGEKSLAMEEAERTTIENTKEVYPGLFVSGMAANAVSGSFRMGPIFGGMLLSGRKVAELIDESLDQPAAS